MEKVKISGKVYPVLFGLSTVKNFAVAKGMETVNDFEAWYEKASTGNLSIMGDMSELLLLGIKRGCQKNGTECDLDADDILDLVTNEPEAFSTLSSIMGKFMQTEAPGKPSEGKGPKKK